MFKHFAIRGFKCVFKKKYIGVKIEQNLLEIFKNHNFGLEKKKIKNWIKDLEKM